MIRSPLFYSLLVLFVYWLDCIFNRAILKSLHRSWGINVWLLAREKVSNFLFGMITVAVFLYILLHKVYMQWQYWRVFNLYLMYMVGIIGLHVVGRKR